MGATIFSQLDITINNDLAISSQHYDYSSLIQTLLSLNKGAKHSWLQGGLFYKDTAGQMDIMGNNNSGFQKRSGQIAQSNVIELMVKIYSVFFYQNKLLPNNTCLTLDFTRQKDTFCLLAMI